MKINEKLIRYRKNNALTRGELAEKLSISSNSISEWETGQSIPNTEMLDKIAVVFKTSVDKLLDENDNPFEEKNNNNKKSSSIKISIILVSILLGIFSVLLNQTFNNARKYEEPISVFEMFRDYSIEEIFNRINKN